MDLLGSVTYNRTYNRFNPETGKWEEWEDTAMRVAEHSASLLPTSDEEKQKVFELIRDHKLYPAGRVLWMGFTEFVRKNPALSFNCTFVVLRDIHRIAESMMLALLGAGTALRVLYEDVEHMPNMYPTNVEAKEYEQKYPHVKKEYTDCVVDDEDSSVLNIVVGDSKKGWETATLNTLLGISNKDIKTIRINYDYVRPAGVPLRSSAGTASGHEIIKKALGKLGTISRDELDGNVKPIENNRYRPIHWLDTFLTTMECVYAGGVRRTATMCLFSPDDEEIKNCKNYIDWSKDFHLFHRTGSNNTMFVEEKPTLTQLGEMMKSVRFRGEPGILNVQEAKRRCEGFEGVNACSEIALRSEQSCNLTTVNIPEFIDHNTGELNFDELYEAQRYSARIGYRQTEVELGIGYEGSKWDHWQKKDRLTGCSLTGIRDAIFITDKHNKNYNWREIFEKLRKVAHDAIEEIAKEHGMNGSKLVTTIKPEGSISTLTGVSQGLHYPIFKYAIKNMRIGKDNPIIPACRKAGFNIVPDPSYPDTVLIVQIPVESICDRGQDDVPAIEQLETYKMIMESYVDHNASNTITVGEDEWDGVVEWIHSNWDSYFSLSFLAKSDPNATAYPLMPYEKIDKETYDKMAKNLKPIESKDLAPIIYDMLDTNDSDCASGMCPVR